MYYAADCMWSNFWSDSPHYCNDSSLQGVSGSSATCFDNAGVAGATSYSLTQNNGNGVNCALSFKMQAGD
jgi:hypothetical protein